MSDSKTTLYNQALAEAGITRRISLPTEDSVEAETCELYYDLFRRSVLSAAHWPSARGAFRLNQLAAKDDTTDWALGDPQPGWLYAHALPSDYIRARYINNMEIFELSTYTAADSATQNAIISNQEQVVLTYTRDQTKIDAWEVSLRMAMVYALASAIVYAMTGKMNRTDMLLQQANEAIKTARVEVGNAEEYQQERLAPWLEARHSIYRPTVSQQYIYPHGPLLSFQGVINNA